MFNLGMGELLLLLFLAFVVIGPSDFPKVAKGFIKAVKYGKNLVADIMESLNASLEDEAKEFNEVKNVVEATVKSVSPDGLLDPVKNGIAPIVEEFTELGKIVETANKGLADEMDALVKNEKSIKAD